MKKTKEIWHDWTLTNPNNKWFSEEEVKEAIENCCPKNYGCRILQQLGIK